MALFRASASAVLAESLAGTLAGRLELAYPHQVGHRPASSEIRSWNESLPVLARELVEAGLGDVELLLEHQLPLSPKRVDAIACGVHPRTGAPSYVLIELKQWSSATCPDDAPDLCLVPSYGTRPVLHPAEQVRRYCWFLRDFAAALSTQDDPLAGVAFLHNATTYSVDDLSQLSEDQNGRLFAGDRRAELRDFLRSRLDPTSGAESADQLVTSRVAPSRTLMATAASEVRDREQFVLLDEQQVAFRAVTRAVERARRADRKEVIIVTGGPGSGKSVIALSLLGELWRQGVPALHATGSSSFTKTMRRTAGRGNRRIQELFRYFNSFMTAEKNGLDVLLCDEAHRIRLTSANRWTKGVERTGRSQVEELIESARVPVFLLDEHQVVRPGETGTVDVIGAAATVLGLPVTRIDLDGQFRCGGSRAYEEWVLRLLGLAPGGPVAWEGDDAFELNVCSGPEEMEDLLQCKLNDDYTARMTAGYCWKWSDPRPDGTLVPDVFIGEWARPWNLKGDRSVGGAPPSALWATDPAGFGQVGCVYTAQGFEYAWNGVIIGPDLVWRTDRWVAQAKGSKDPAFRGLSDEEIEPLVRNVYKVLLTRGMNGTAVISVDPETQDKLSSLVNHLSGRAAAERKGGVRSPAMVAPLPPSE